MRSVELIMNVLLHFANLRDAEAKRASWKLNDISEVSEQESQGCIRAKFDVKGGPIKPTTTALQFAAEGATLSGADFELVGPGYRISLTKKRFATGLSCMNILYCSFYLDHKNATNYFAVIVYLSFTFQMLYEKQFGFCLVIHFIFINLRCFYLIYFLVLN